MPHQPVIHGEETRLPDATNRNEGSDGRMFIVRQLALRVIPSKKRLRQIGRTAVNEIGVEQENGNIVSTPAHATQIEVKKRRLIVV